MEHFRPLLPVGYRAGLRAYQDAVKSISVETMTDHYSKGQEFFHEEFIPHLKSRLSALSSGAWNFDDFAAYAAGADTDLMAHIVEAADAVCVFPGDWHGFRVGVSRPERVPFSGSSAGKLACVCVPSVRNGHVTDEVLRFLSKAEACLLNINLYPTLPAAERFAVATALQPVMQKALVSVSFSRGFGLTASQLGVLLVPRDHPLRSRFGKQWEWHTYFYNAIAARAFMALDGSEIERVDELRREEVGRFLAEHGIPSLKSGSYYVRSFRLDGQTPRVLEPLVRDSVVRLCMKPSIV